MMNIIDFEQLVLNIENTHNYFQLRASKQIDLNLSLRNWLIGYYLVEFEQRGQDRAIYGNKTVPTLVKKMKHIKGFSRSNLLMFKSFYQTYPQIVQILSAQLENSPIQFTPPIVQTLSGQLESIESYPPETLLSHLSFSHFVALIQLDSDIKRRFYEVQVIQNSWSVRTLERAINTLLFERTGLSSDKRGMIESHKNPKTETAGDLIRSPFILEFMGLNQSKKISENQLETAIINHLQDFLIEMGRGFCFEARQKRITFDNEHYYIDLVFYHRILRCHILVDLKVGKFSHADGGQMNFYLNYYKNNEMGEYDNPPIGIILCANKNDTFVEYTIGGLDNEIFVSKYLIELPKVDELKRLIEEDMKK
ncbi:MULTISPECIES: YhcG family protein [Flectobacillus]|uniref:PDDEXK nuclease domain-containing protein n=1 Tax=Flectobacillus TaxID=101 RepID=UPI000BA399EC|nr:MULTISPECIES: PDDEXK nuclease domain-containing protein [Flectobacillus]MDI9868585.1 PDDEXK nuclease domain-containing protein [Flectobacillus roseus]PAC31455.1 cytoplasmic protein [Flectobacillus sp. BAB-3569]